jgi:hypothetical protein
MASPESGDGQSGMMEGYLFKRGHVVRSWRRRFCSLDSHYINYFRRIGDPRPRGRLFLIGADIDARVASSAANGKSHVFSVTSKDGKAFLFQCADDQMREVSQ